MIEAADTITYKHPKHQVLLFGTYKTCYYSKHTQKYIFLA